MKSIIKSYINFSRTERIGIIGLLSLLIILIAIRATLHYWVKPAVEDAQQQKFVSAWNQFKNKLSAKADSDSLKKQETKDDVPFTRIVNINTADSATLCQLQGIGPAISHKIIEYRRQHPFRTIDELATLPRFPKSTFWKIRKQITIK